MGLQNFESLVAKDTSKPDCSPRISTLTTTNSSFPKNYKQTLLTGQVIKTRPNACKLAVIDKITSGVPDMPSTKDKSKVKEHKRFNPYLKHSSSKKTDQNYSCQNESGKSGNHLASNIARLPLRDLSTESGDSEWPLPASALSVPSPFLNAENISEVCPSKSGANLSSLQSGHSMKQAAPSEGRLGVAAGAGKSSSLTPPKESPLAPLFSPLSQSESPIRNIHSYVLQDNSSVHPKASKSPMFHNSKSSLPSPLSSVSKKSAPASDTRSPSQHSSLQLKKSNRDAQYSLKEVQEGSRNVLIVSSSSSDDLSTSGASKAASSSSSGNSRKGKKMRIHKRRSSTRKVDDDVIIIGDHPRPRKRVHKSSSSSDDFEDFLSSHKKQRCDTEVIDLTLLEDSPPQIRCAKPLVTPSRRSDPNRTPELTSSSDEGIGKCLEGKASRSQRFTPVRKALQFPSSELSESERTPRINTTSKFNFGEDNSDEEKESGIDDFISMVDELTEKSDGERLYEALSESSSFHSVPSVEGNVETSPATPKLKMSGNLELVQGFTLDLNSEEDDDDVFNDDQDQEPTPRATDRTTSGSLELLDNPTTPLQNELTEQFDPLSHTVKNTPPGHVTVMGNQKGEVTQQPGEGCDVAVVHVGGGLAPLRSSKGMESSAQMPSGVAEHGIAGCVLATQCLGGANAQLLDDIATEQVQSAPGDTGSGGARNGKSMDASKSAVSLQSEVNSMIDSLGEHNSNLGHRNLSAMVVSSPLEVPMEYTAATQSAQSTLTAASPHTVNSSVLPSLETLHNAGPTVRRSGILLQELRPVLAGRGVATELLVEDEVDFFTMTQDNVVGNKLQDGTRLPSQRLCFVAKYLRLFTSRRRTPGADILSQLWQLLWKPLVSGSDQLTGEAVAVCMQYLKQLLVLHPPGQHKLVDQQYADFLTQIVMDSIKSSTFSLWDHLESLLKCRATTVMATFLIDLLLADLWAATTTGRSDPPLLVRLFWNSSSARNISLPLRRLMDRIDTVAADLNRSVWHNDQIDNLMALLYMACTTCADLSTELILRWSKLKGHTQSFLVGCVCSLSLQSKLADSLPEVKRIHTLFKNMFSRDLGIFHTRVKSVQLQQPSQEELKTTALEKCTKAANQPPAPAPPVFVCAKSKHSTTEAAVSSVSSMQSPSKNRSILFDGTSRIPVLLTQQRNLPTTCSQNQPPWMPRMHSSSCSSSSSSCITISNQGISRHTSISVSHQVKVVLNDIRHAPNVSRIPIKSPTNSLVAARRVERCDHPRRTSEGGNPNKSHKHHHRLAQECNNNNNIATSSLMFHVAVADCKEHNEGILSTPALQSTPETIVEKMRSKSAETSFKNNKEKARSKSADSHTNSTKSSTQTPCRKDYQKVRKNSKDKLSRGLLEKIMKAQAPPKPNHPPTPNELPLGSPIGVIVHKRNPSPAQKLWDEQHKIIQHKQSRARRLSGGPQTGEIGKNVTKVPQQRRSSVNLPATSRDSQSMKSSVKQKMLHDLLKVSKNISSPPITKFSSSSAQPLESHGKAKTDDMLQVGHTKQPFQSLPPNIGSSRKSPVPRTLPLNKPTVPKGSSCLTPGKQVEEQVRQGMLHKEDLPKTTMNIPPPAIAKLPSASTKPKDSHGKAKSDMPLIGHKYCIKQLFPPSSPTTGTSHKPPVPRTLPLNKPTVPKGSSCSTPGKQLEEQVRSKKAPGDIPLHHHSSPKTPERPYQKLAQKRSPKKIFPIIKPSKSDKQTRRSSVDAVSRPLVSPRQFSEHPVHVRLLPHSNSLALKEKLMRQAHEEAGASTESVSAPAFQHLLQLAEMSKTPIEKHISNAASTELRKEAVEGTYDRMMNYALQASSSKSAISNKKAPTTSAISNHSPNQHQPTPTTENTNKPGKKTDSRHTTLLLERHALHSPGTSSHTSRNTDTHTASTKFLHDHNRYSKPAVSTRPTPTNTTPSEH